MKDKGEPRGKLVDDVGTLSGQVFNGYPGGESAPGTDGIFKDKVEQYGDVGDTRRGKG